MQQPVFDTIARIRDSAAFATARACVHGTDAETVADMQAAAAIAAPTGAETQRGRWLAGRLHALGLATEVDDVGNVIAATPAADPAAGEIVVASHLDTVFDAATDLTLHARNGRLAAPGISDNARGLAGLLAIARALDAAGWPTRAPVVLVGTVGEEGAGDLRGAKHYIAQRGSRAGAFIALDGAGASRIIHAGVGSRRLRVTFTGRGGHSWADWGEPNAVHAAGRAIAALCDLQLPAEPRTTLTVARMGGGTSINAIAAEAWLEIDLRSEQGPPLQALEQRVRDAVQRAAAAESATSATVACDIVVFGDRPPGATPPSHPLVRLAEDATRAVGLTPELTSSSTDANVAMAAALPAIAIGAGGTAGGMHTTAEWYENEEGHLGIERALLLILAAAGLRD
jgi:tripeptide aminopeptidase